MENKIIRKCSTHGKEYKLEFPITIPAVIQNPIQLVKLGLSSTMRQSLKDIILNRGDEQRHSSNVKADMTDWYMHQHYQEFMQLSLLAEAQSQYLPCHEALKRSIPVLLQLHHRFSPITST